MPKSCKVDKRGLPPNCKLTRFATESDKPKDNKEYDFKIKEKKGEKILVSYGKLLPANAVILDGITEIAPKAFAKCKILQSVVIPASVKIVDKQAFSECENLKKVTLTEGLEKICEGAFYDCKELEGIVFPNTLKLIADEAFYGCDKIKSVRIPGNVRVVGKYAFMSCALSKVTVDAGVRMIGEEAFCKNPLAKFKLIIPTDCFCNANVAPQAIVTQNGKPLDTEVSTSGTAMYYALEYSDAEFKEWRERYKNRYSVSTPSTVSEEKARQMAREKELADLIKQVNQTVSAQLREEEAAKKRAEEEARKRQEEEDRRWAEAAANEALGELLYKADASPKAKRTALRKRYGRYTCQLKARF